MQCPRTRIVELSTGRGAVRSGRSTATGQPAEAPPRLARRARGGARRRQCRGLRRPRRRSRTSDTTERYTFTQIGDTREVLIAVTGPTGASVRASGPRRSGPRPGPRRSPRAAVAPPRLPARSSMSRSRAQKSKNPPKRANRIPGDISFKSDAVLPRFRVFGFVYDRRNGAGRTDNEVEDH